MEIKHLEPAVISKLRSSSDIPTAAQCVFELVCNSLDAKPTSIAVRLNLLTFKIQVIDNGDGISKENMSLLGQRYATNKCRSLVDLERHRKTYGYRGEALAGIVEMSRGVTVTSRQKESQETYTKVLSRNLNSEVKLVQFRASEGTTVTVLGWLSSVPVRQQRIVPEIELEEVKVQLEKLIIINPKISFTLRNDVTGQLILNSPKSSDILTALCHLYHEAEEDFTLLKVSKSKVSIQLLIKKDLSWSGKNVQYIYVNKRPVRSSKILKQVKTSFIDLKKQQTRKHPVFVMNIKCPQIYVDLMAKSYNQEVEFTCWDLVLICIDKLGKAFKGLKDPEKCNTSIEVPKKQPDKEKENWNCGASQLFGVVQAAAFKRKSSDDHSQPKIRKPKWRKDLVSQGTEGNYDIHDSEDNQPKKPAQIKSIMKKKPALNIQVQPVNVAPSKEKQFDQCSIYSRLDTNEEDGKMLIMDMFLKSTQIYKNDGYAENVDTELTFEESNYLFENNVQDAVNGINTTMSVSVNVKRRRLNKTDKNPHVEDLQYKEPVVRQRRLTPSQNLQKTTTNCMQTQKRHPQKSDNADRLELRCSQTEIQCDYTIAIEGNDQKPQYVFRKKSEEELIANRVVSVFKPLIICDDDHHDARIFNFGSQKSILKHTHEFKKPRTPDNPRKTITQSPYFHRKENVIKSPFFKQAEQPNYTPQIPVAAPELRYYLPPQNLYCCNPCNCYAPVYPTGFYPVVNQFQATTTCPTVENKPEQKQENWPVSSSPFFSEGGQKSTTDKEGILNTESCVGKTAFNPFSANEPKQRQNDWFSLNSPLSLFSEDKSPKNQDNCDRKLSDLSALELSLKEIQDNNQQKSQSRIVIDSQNEWLKQRNENGDKYFLNSRTGMVTAKTPTTNKTYFSFGTRLNFVPKGLSPALKTHKEVDISLSQNAKDKLQEKILEGYGDEEMLNKWQNYISNDPKAFFEEIYKDKSEQFEPCIPTLQNKILKVPLSYINYDHQSFKNMKIIGQLDNKFIVALETNCNMLVLFDQHAVHERILVEKHFKELKVNKTTCASQVTIFMPANDVDLLKLHSKYVESLGLKLEYISNGVHVTQVPLCLQDKLESEAGGPETVNTLVKEVLERLKSIKAPAGGLPQVLQKVINSKACRGAIKFGDALARKQCQVLVNDLSKCKLPFQCAHGRPTLTPLLSLSKVDVSEKVKKVNLSRLRLQF